MEDHGSTDFTNHTSVDLDDERSPPSTTPYVPQAEALDTGSPQLDAIPHQVHSNVDFSHLQGSRIFLDLCSGASHPLTSAMLQRNCVCFPVDLLISQEMDILDNSFYEPLLRVCSSGCVAYAAASPNCGEYSRLKLRANGPPALRTPEHLQGLPNLTPERTTGSGSDEPHLNDPVCIMLRTGLFIWRTLPPGTTTCTQIHQILCFVFGQFPCLCFLS